MGGRKVLPRPFRSLQIEFFQREDGEKIDILDAEDGILFVNRYFILLFILPIYIPALSRVLTQPRFCRHCPFLSQQKEVAVCL